MAVFRVVGALLLSATMLAGAVAAHPPEGQAPPGQPASAAAPPAADVARQLQTHYETVRDFSADFTHTYEGGVLRRKTTERGTVLIRKPGRMRWAYTSPEEKLFVSDGVKMYAWVPADRQVTVSSLPQTDQAATPLLFLVGRGNIVRDFDVTWAPTIAGAPAASYALQLMPKKRVADYDALTVVVDRASMALRMLVARDSQGGTSTFTFANLKENVGVADSKFTFTIPRGAEVVQGS